ITRLRSISCHFSVSLLSRSPDLRDLHSFPTRRSSDLSTPCPRRCSDTACRTKSPCRSNRCRCAGRGASEGSRTDTYSNGKVIWRSEEHTSELQSRVDLVCRLLLEKKNKRKSW